MLILPLIGLMKNNALLYIKFLCCRKFQILHIKMSFFGKLFGKSSDKDPVTTGEAIQKLRETEEMLMKKQDFLEKKIDQEVATAKKNAKTNKRAALQALKRKKR